ncbi:MAG: glycosyltransferase family 39 protein [Planctomycetes bacterium]|nr:glycosyltransferase family 39 protein [Planctomycetota bacterium]
MRYLLQTIRDVCVTTLPSAVVALAAWISIVVSIDPGGSYPSMPEGPGITVDEIFNVEQGVYLVEQSRSLGWFNLLPTGSAEAYRPENGYNPDHPPLGRYWLGVHHHFAWMMAPPQEPGSIFVTACARTGSATAFALTVWLVGAFATFSAASMSPGHELRFHRWVGPLTSLMLVLMPRVYGHAHLAALETVTNLTCTAAVLSLAAWWSGPDRPTHRAALFAGFLMGLALLTKVQAVLIPIPVILWTLFRWRQQGIVTLLIWGMTALIVFFAGWPYLWLDPVGHLFEYLGRTTNRVTLYCYYFGTRFADKDVPWHYPFVMFAVTVPVGLQALGLLGVCSGLRTSRTTTAESGPNRASIWAGRLVLACGLFPLIIFAFPGVAVYDGERLFLTVFPLWAIFVGKGAVQAMRLVVPMCGQSLVKMATSGLILAQLGSNLMSHPVYLSYYNLAVGGLAGAESLGLELNYWGDSLTRSLLTEAVQAEEQFAHVEIRPSLHQFQSEDLVLQSPILRRHLKPVAGADSRKLYFLFHRRADFDDERFRRYQRPGGGRFRNLATFKSTNGKNDLE